MTTSVRPASRRLVARMMPSSADWPVPWRSLNARSVNASLTAITGHSSAPSASRRRSRTSPVVVSSVAPPGGLPCACSAVTRSAPSSSVMCGSPAATATTCAAHASMSSPWIACTFKPSSASAAATSSCVERGFGAHSATSAPPARSVRTRFAVSEVTCRQAPTLTPASGCSAAKRSAIERSTGIWASAQSIRARPSPARLGSLISDLVAVMVGLVGPLDREAEVGGLLGAQLGELGAERVEVQPGDLLVEVLGQHVDLLGVLVGLRVQLDLGDRLVRERVRHHEARVARGVAEDVSGLDHVLERGDLVALHRGLQRADRIDLGDDDTGALAAQRLRAALADVAVAEDDRDLAADHHVGATVDPVDQRVPAAVEVVELRLGDRVVDVDRREEELARVGELVEAVHAGRRLLG